MGDLALANITFKTISFKKRCDQKVLGEGRVTQKSVFNTTSSFR